MTDLIALVNEQAEDEGLWFIDATCSEAYLQAALRKLHAAIETRAPAATPPTAWRVWWVSLNTARTELFEDIAKANAKARETGGCVIPLYAAAAATPPNRWRHKKRGTTYVLLGNAITQTEAPLSDMDPVLVYQSEKDGTLWVRPGHEFLDGRFEEISPVTRPNRGDAT